MTREEINLLGIEELETRAAEIAAETATAEPEALEALNKELDAIEERKKTLAIEAEERKQAAEAVKNGAGKPVEVRKESEKMTNKEIRNSKEYIDAFAKYIKTGKDAECRALLTENVTGGTVPVPEFVQSRVEANWERDEVWRRIRKTYVRGNLKVGFEISATDAVVHTEGANAPAEEVLTLGIVNMVPQTIKKWISFSTEVMALGSEEFLAYIYDELTYKIIKKAADIVIDRIIGAPGTSNSAKIGVPSIEIEEGAAVDAAAIINAMALLGDEARDLVFIADPSVIAAIKIAALSAGYAYDPFQGMTVIPRTITIIEEGESVTWNGAIIGDLSGIQANLPEGDAVRFVFDEYSLAEADLVKVVGRLYAAIEIVQPGMFATIVEGDK